MYYIPTESYSCALSDDILIEAIRRDPSENYRYVYIYPNENVRDCQTARC